MFAYIETDYSFPSPSGMHNIESSYSRLCSDRRLLHTHGDWTCSLLVLVTAAIHVRRLGQSRIKFEVYLLRAAFMCARALLTCVREGR